MAYDSGLLQMHRGVLWGIVMMVCCFGLLGFPGSLQTLFWKVGSTLFAAAICGMVSILLSCLYLWILGGMI